MRCAGFVDNELLDHAKQTWQYFLYPSLKEVKAVLLFCHFSLFFQPVRTRNLYSFLDVLFFFIEAILQTEKVLTFPPFDGFLILSMVRGEVHQSVSK